MKQHDHYQFWRRDDLWPTALGYVFLASVVQQIGKALFGDEWLESDPYAEPYRDPRPGETYSLADLYGLPTQSNPMGGRPFDPNPSDAAHAANGAALRRLEVVRTSIVDAGLKGTLVFGTQPQAGGAVTKLPPVVWQTEQARLRFRFCKIDPFNPFSNAFDGGGLHYLFVTADSLRRFLGAVQRRAASAQAVDVHSAPRKRGRKKGSGVYQWADFNAACLEILRDYGGINLADDSLFTKAELTRQMKKWIAKHWLDGDGEPTDPADSTIRHHCDDVIAIYEDQQRKAAENSA